MFSNLFGKKEDQNQSALFKDKVYINTSAKTNACIQLAIKVPGIIFVAWFNETAAFYKVQFSAGTHQMRLCIESELHGKH